MIFKHRTEGNPQPSPCGGTEKLAGHLPSACGAASEAFSVWECWPWKPSESGGFSSNLLPALAVGEGIGDQYAGLRAQQRESGEGSLVSPARCWSERSTTA